MSVGAAALQIADEDKLRADWYFLLAQLLGGAPEQDLLGRLSQLQGDDSELGKAISALSRAAGAANPAQLNQEYFDLFIGVGQGELLPFGSYYLTGFLNEKPLARLRIDMNKLMIAREEEVKEPEDHIASLCEMMAGLITGAFGDPADLETQKNFFDKHIGCWAPRFFEDLEAAPSASFYMPVGSLGRLFMAVEAQAFEMAA